MYLCSKCNDWSYHPEGPSGSVEVKEPTAMSEPKKEWELYPITSPGYEGWFNFIHNSSQFCIGMIPPSHVAMVRKLITDEGETPNDIAWQEGYAAGVKASHKELSLEEIRSIPGMALILDVDGEWYLTKSSAQLIYDKQRGG